MEHGDNIIELSGYDPFGPPRSPRASRQSSQLGTFNVLQVPPFLTHIPDTHLNKMSTQTFQGNFLEVT